MVEHNRDPPEPILRTSHTHTHIHVCVWWKNHSPNNRFLAPHPLLTPVEALTLRSRSRKSRVGITTTAGLPLERAVGWGGSAASLPPFRHRGAMGWVGSLSSSSFCWFLSLHTRAHMAPPSGVGEPGQSRNFIVYLWKICSLPSFRFNVFINTLSSSNVIKNWANPRRGCAEVIRTSRWLLVEPLLRVEEKVNWKSTRQQHCAAPVFCAS